MHVGSVTQMKFRLSSVEGMVMQSCTVTLAIANVWLQLSQNCQLFGGGWKRLQVYSEIGFVVFGHIHKADLALNYDIDKD